MEQIAEMTVQTSLFASQMLFGLSGLQGVTFRLDYPDFGDHLYRIVGVQQDDPMYLKLRCVVLDPPTTQDIESPSLVPADPVHL